VLKKAGLEGRDTVFLFSDTQIVQEGFLEDLNNILNAGGMLSTLWLHAAAISQAVGHYAGPLSAVDEANALTACIPSSR
jgi:hypothetical protein